MKSAKSLSKTGQRHTLLLWLVAGLGFFAARNAIAAEYYVSTTGSDSNAGTQAAPFATLQKAAGMVAAGDTVWIRGGTYKITTPASSGAGIQLSKSGTSNTNRIKYWAFHFRSWALPRIWVPMNSELSGRVDRPEPRAQQERAARQEMGVHRDWVAPRPRAAEPVAAARRQFQPMHPREPATPCRLAGHPQVAERYRQRVVADREVAARPAWQAPVARLELAAPLRELAVR
jgi:hypothetical protein